MKNTPTISRNAYQPCVQAASPLQTGLRTFNKSLKLNYQLYLLLIPVIINFIIFAYVPMTGVQIAFKDYSIRKGIWGSAWCGFEHFERLFTSANFAPIFWNTLILSVLNMLFSFPIPIILALLLNEINHRVSGAFQTIFIIPHFVSVVVVVGILVAFCSPSTGVINVLLKRLNLIDESIYFTRMSQYFRPSYIISGIWQSVGWDAVIYISALSAIDPTIYEAASIDGASRFKQLLKITIPSVLPTIIIMLILKSGKIMSVGYEKVYLMQTTTTLDVSEVISTYVYKKGIGKQEFDYATAVGLFDSVINLSLLAIVNRISKKVSEVSLW
ncbi:MAG: ABC transporter permease subunit [Eubacteriales bacterium]|nr:ABC transporter permease subunit [Eubacteriales bacterium]